MAIAIDKLTLGSAAIDSASTTIAFTTSSAVAASGFIVLHVGWFGNGPTLSLVSGGSLTWTIDKQGNNLGGVAANTAIVSAQAPSGLASGTTITATYSVSVAGGRSIAGTSFTGVATSSPVDGTPPAAASFATTTAWASGSATLAGGSVLVASVHQDTTNLTSTPTSPSIEMFDINGGAGSFSATGAYRIESVGAAYTVAGTWSANGSGGVVAAAYKVASGGGGAAVKQLAQLGVG